MPTLSCTSAPPSTSSKMKNNLSYDEWKEIKEVADEEVKEERRDEIMELQQDISFDKSADMVGRELIVIIDGKIADENAYIGRTYMDAPGIDGNIFVNTYEELMSGDIVKVKVIGSYEYDLIGEII